MAKLRSETPAKHGRGRGRPPKSQSNSPIPTANRPIAPLKSKLPTKGVAPKVSSQQLSSPAARTRSSLMSRFGYEDVDSLSILESQVVMQVSVSNVSSPQVKKVAFQTDAHRDASDALIRENRIRSQALAAKQKAPKIDRVEWFADNSDGSRCHMWRVLIRDSWPGQDVGEGKVFDRGDDVIDGTYRDGEEEEENDDVHMADADEEKEAGTTGAAADSDTTVEESETSDSVAGKENVQPTTGDLQTNNNAENGQRVRPTTRGGGVNLPNSKKVQATTPPQNPDFEIYTEASPAGASQAQVHSHAQEGGGAQGEEGAVVAAAASMSVEMIGGRAVLMPIEAAGVAPAVGLSCSPSEEEEKALRDGDGNALLSTGDRFLLDAVVYQEGGEAGLGLPDHSGMAGFSEQGGADMYVVDAMGIVENGGVVHTVAAVGQGGLDSRVVAEGAGILQGYESVAAAPAAAAVVAAERALSVPPQMTAAATAQEGDVHGQLASTATVAATTQPDIIDMSAEPGSRRRQPPCAEQ